MKAKLVAQWGSQKGAEFWIGGEASIGRGADNEVRLEAKPVSSQHARIFFDSDAEAYFLEDLGSLNGTEIDGTAVTRIERLGRMHVLNFGGVCELLWVEVNRTPAAAQTAEAPGTPSVTGEGTRVDDEAPVLPAALADGESAASGATVVEAEAVLVPDELSPVASGGAAHSEPAVDEAPADSPEAAEPKADPEPEPEPEEEPEAAASTGVEYILAVIDEGTTRRYLLRPGENLVGRSKGAQVALASPQLSRKHAVVTVAGETVTIQDLGSRNRTFVDEKQVEAEVEVEVRSRLRFGLVEAYLLRHDEDEDLTLPRKTTKEGE